MSADEATILESARAEAESVAESCRSLAEVGRVVNRRLALHWSDAKWRGLFKSNPDLRNTVQARLRRVAPVVTNEPHPEGSRPFDIERFIYYKLQADAEWAKKERRFDPLNLQIDSDVPILHVNLADVHVGAPGVPYERVQGDLGFIAGHPHIYSSWGGDGINNFVLQALQFAGMNDTFAPGSQQFAVMRHFLNILIESDSLSYVGIGNHDAWTERLTNLDLRDTLFQGVEQVYTGQGGRINLTVGSQTYRVYRRHRPRYSSMYNPAHAVIQEYRNSPYDFDIGVLEHQHLSHGSEFEGKERPDGSTTRIAIRPGPTSCATRLRKSAVITGLRATCNA